MAPLLSVEGVSKEFQVRGKRIVALESITLALEQGEFVTVVGPSGCGKSTLLNLIVGLLGPSAGRILLRGRPIDGVNPDIGYVTQKDNLLPWRTLRAPGLLLAILRRRAESAGGQMILIPGGVAIDVARFRRNPSVSASTSAPVGSWLNATSTARFWRGIPMQRGCSTRARRVAPGRVRTRSCERRGAKL